MKIILPCLIVLLFFFGYAKAQEVQPQSKNSFAQYELDQGVRDYRERKFAQAEEHFRRALQSDSTLKIAEKLLAKTLYQEFLTKRDAPENIAKGEEAIEIYQAILTANPNDEDTNRAVSYLIETIKGEAAKFDWLRERAGNQKVNAEFRATALTALAAKTYTCVNEITESLKKTIVRGDKTAYVFRKSKNLRTFETAKRCADEGLVLIDEALALDEMNDSSWAYKASFLIQKARLAEMDGNAFDKDKFTAESEQAKTRFINVNEEKARRKKQAERESANQSPK